MQEQIYIVTDGDENLGFINKNQYYNLKRRGKLTAEKDYDCWSMFDNRLNKVIFIYRVNHLKIEKNEIQSSD